MSYDEHLISMAGGDGDELDQIQARADAATEGPWHYGTGYSADGVRELTEKVEKASFLTLSLNDDGRPLSVIDNGKVIPAVTGDGPKAKANADFIAHARTDIPALVAMVREQRAVIERVRELHVPHEESGKCNECTVSPFSMHSVKYPCPTIDALTTPDPS